MKFADVLDKHFKLYASCIPVKGARRSIICDLQRENFDFIPNVLFEICSQFNGSTVREIYQYVGEANIEVMDSYMELLESKSYCFFTSEPDNFPALNLDWDSPSEVTNSIIDFDSNSNHDIAKIVEELNSVACIAVQMRFYYSPDMKYVRETLSLFEQSRIRSIEIVLVYSNSYSIEDFKVISDNFPRVSALTLTSSPSAKILKREKHKLSFDVNMLKSAFSNSNCCGEIKSNNFRVNTPLFTESLRFNSCLNRKISVDANGDIKNCPTSVSSFGKVGDISFQNVLKVRQFKTLWNINKDQIDICKHCEFRYICTDCRVILQKPEDLFSKPLKCKYDPYDAEWN